METNSLLGRPTPQKRARRGVIIAVIAALVAVLALSATAVAAHVNATRLDTRPATWWHGNASDAPGTPGVGGPGRPDGMRGPGGPGGPNGHGGPGGMGFGQAGFPGMQGVVTAVDANAKTITLAGVIGVTTVSVDNTIKLSTRQADGTTKDAAITDFKTGQAVQVRGKIDRSQFQPGQRPDPPKTKFTLTELVVDTTGIVRSGGLVTAVNGNSYTVSAMGGLTLTVTAANGAKITKGDKSAGSASDIKVGDRVSLQGTQQGATVNATDIRIMTGGFGPSGGPSKP